MLEIINEKVIQGNPNRKIEIVNSIDMNIIGTNINVGKYLL